MGANWSPGDAEHLRVHPSVVFKLGEDLITDEVQALVELIKNSYDADSPVARVVVDTEVINTTTIGNRSEDLKGRIEIQDRGVGMTREELIQGWLTVSNSWKRRYKTEGLLPAGQVKPKRTPLGDKGLGRLGAQRLGDVLEVETRSTNDPSGSVWRVVIPWRLFDVADSLDEVPIVIERNVGQHPRPGTTLRILGLKDTLWTEAGAQDELRRHLAALVSPFGQKRGFKVEITINGTPLDLYEVTTRLRSAAEVAYKFEYLRGVLTIAARVTRDFFRPNLQRDIGDFERNMEADDGQRFSEWLFASRDATVKRLGIVRGQHGYLFEAKHSISAYEQTSKLSFVDGDLVDPGPFEGEVDAVDLGSDRSGVFDSRSQYRDFVRSVSGIKVFRDGFGIRTPGDWLNLGARWSTGRSFYSLRPDNVIGYIDITANANPQLQETTDREGFRITPAYQNFYTLLQSWLDYTANLHDALRRSWLDYVRTERQSDAGFESTATPEELLQRVDRTIRDVGQSRKTLERAREDVDRVRKQSSRIARETGANLDSQSEFGFEGFESSQRIREALLAIQAATDRITTATVEADQILSRAQAEREAIAVVSDQLEVLREQLSDSWATVALGITAEALTHEMLNVVDRLRGQTSAIDRHLKAHHIADKSIATYLEYVRSAASALNRQLDHLNPGLRYMRDRKDSIRISELLEDFSTFFATRYTADTMKLKVIVGADFTVLMNRGRLTQVLDNLILNSEFWIKEQQRRRKFDGVITLQCEKPHVVVTDNGPGVSLNIEESLFEPFVTTKPRDRRGRGLGLFVARQLLDGDGCTIRLLPDRDADGRRHAFEIDLSGATSGGSA
jgi:signal transduction histidine kinase